MRSTFAVVAAGLLASALAVSAQRPVTPAGMFPPLETYLESLRQQAGIPGMSVGVVQDGQVVWERGFGYQNVASRIRATPDTPYLVGGISETLAAVLLLQCVEQRRLDLDEPARKYGVSLPESSATLRHILSHTSADVPGEAFLFSPDRYAQLTSAMEWCAPQPYRKSVAHRLLNRLAMKDSVPGTDMQSADADIESGLFDEADIDKYRRVLQRLAVGYKVDSRGRAERTEIAAASLTAATGLVSTVRDLARLDAALDSEVLLLDDTLAAAWRPVTSRSGTQLPAGLGWFVQYYRGERVVWQFGSVTNAYSSLVIKLPARHLTFILLANSEGLSAPFQLEKGDVSRSVFATLFLRIAT
jgi:Beta-lactamase class C and other penicillin binding proteins